MSRFEKKLDNYYTKKVIEKIREKLCMFCIDLIFEEDVETEEKERIYIKINLPGKNELKNPRKVMQFYKNESLDLLFNNDFYNYVRTCVEKELENIQRGW